MVKKGKVAKDDNAEQTNGQQNSAQNIPKPTERARSKAVNKSKAATKKGVTETTIVNQKCKSWPLATKLGFSLANPKLQQKKGFSVLKLKPFKLRRGQLSQA